jgi:hypothetical protein
MKVLKKIIQIVLLLGVGFSLYKAIKEGLNVKRVMKTYETQSKFNNLSLDYNDQKIDQKSVAALCSSVNLDFDKSAIEHKQGILDVFGRFSAIKVIIPKKWKLHLDGVQNSSAILHEVETAENYEDGPVLNIHYDLKYSALSVVHPKDISEIISEEISEIVEALSEEDSFAGEIKEETKALLEESEEALEEQIEDIEDLLKS